VPRSSRIELTAEVTVTQGQAPDENGSATGRRATAYITLERAQSATGWRLVTFTLGPPL
jgi:hypothetical protein